MSVICAAVPFCSNVLEPNAWFEKDGLRFCSTVCVHRWFEQSEHDYTMRLARMCINSPPIGIVDRHTIDPEGVNHPGHYNAYPSGVECIVIVEHLGFNIGNAIKYAWRAGLKSEDPRKDLQKAIWYLNRELERLGK